MSYFFSSDGSLKYSTKSVASIVNSSKSSNNTASSTSSGASSSSSFSNEMKSAAQAASGKITSAMKDAARASNADYQRMAAFQARINKIAAHKPRTFDNETSYTINTSVLSAFSSAQEKYNSYKKTSTGTSSGTSS